MCLLVLAWRAHPRYRLILAANRDEFHARPTAAMAIWPDLPQLLAGRDLEAGGTWLAVDRSRRLGIVTNYRDVQPRRLDAPSRGGLIPGWLASSQTPARAFDALEPDAARYAGFNLLLADAASLGYASNRAAQFATDLTPGIYGLSNGLLDTPWPKLTRVREAFSQWLQSAGPEPDSAPLFNMLADRTRTAPAPAEARPLAPEWVQVLSSPFVVHPRFGTRASSVVMIGDDGTLVMAERRFDATGALTGETAWRLAPGEWPTATDA